MSRPEMTEDATPDGRNDIAVPSTFEMSREMQLALAQDGTDANAIMVPAVAVYWPMSLEDLCTRDSSYRGAVGESPLMVVQNYQEFPDDEQFKGYKGYFRAECVTDAGQRVSWTHYMVSKETGELGPLAAYFQAARVPFALKVVNVATRNGFNVYRPAPLTGGPVKPT